MRRLPSILTLLLPLSSEAQLTLAPVPFTVVAQEAGLNLCGTSPHVEGASTIVLPFSESCGSPSINSWDGEFTSSNVDGRLVQTLGGIFTNSDPDVDSGATLRGQLTISYSIPFTTIGGLRPLPTTTIIDSISLHDTALGGLRRLLLQFIDREGSATRGQNGASAILGDVYTAPQFRLSVGACSDADDSVCEGVFYQGQPSQPRVVIARPFLAGDEVTLDVFFDWRFWVLPSTTTTVDYTAEYELQFVPEPATSWMLPSGGALIAFLSRHRR